MALVFDSIRNYFRRAWGYHTVARLSPRIYRHLKKVYLLSACVMSCSIFGFILHDSGYIESLFPGLALTASTMIYFSFVAPKRRKLRSFLLMAGSLFGGASVIPWSIRFLNLDPRFVVHVLTGIYLGFTCLWSTARRNFRRAYFSAALRYNCLLVAWNLAAPSIPDTHSIGWKIMLYAVCFGVMTCVVADSQEVICKARQRDMDYVMHTIALLTGLPAVTLHIFKLMLIEASTLWDR